MTLKGIVSKLEAEIDRLGLIRLSEAMTIRKTSRTAIIQLIDRGRLKCETILGIQYVYRKEVEEFTKKRPGPAVGTIFKR